MRPGDGWQNANPGTSEPGNLFYNLTDNTRRPILLHRPFRSVAELGYVFRDSPGKTLSFFDGSSGDSALLDFFAVSDAPTVTVGRTNLNSQPPLVQPPPTTAPPSLVQEALLSNTIEPFDSSSPFSNPATLATNYNNYAFTLATTSTPPTPTSTMPLTTAQLANFIASAGGANVTANGLDSIKYHQEAVARALADSSQTRTWNLLIDVVAQTGRYPNTATTLDNFIVEGEKRYWLSVAIDRYTGKIIDEQLEANND